MKNPAKTSASEYLKKPYARLLIPESDGSFRAEILEFPGCIALGDTKAEALEMIERVAESWLEVTIEQGQKVPEPRESEEYSGRFVVRLPKSTHRKAAHCAAQEGVSLNTFVVTAISAHLGEKSVLQSNNVNQQMTFIQTITYYQSPLAAPSLGTIAWRNLESTRTFNPARALVGAQ